jgi:outer membrane protein OmpA-like peptidoglycan-associated protein
MAEDWAIDVKKYVPDADDSIIAGIVRYCGIALTKRDSSLVSMTDPKETGRVRENFLKKKLGLTLSDADLDAAIQKVGQTMKADRTKNRVTVYYLLAAAYGKLELFRKAVKAAPAAKAKAPAKATKAAPAAALGLAAVGAAAAKPAKAAATGATAALGAAGAAVIGTAAAAATGAGNLADKATGAVGAAGAVVAGTAAAAVSGAGDLAGKAADAVGNVASGAVDTVGNAGAAVAGAAGAALAGAAGLAGSAGGAVSGAASGLLGGRDDDDAKGGLGWLMWLLLGLLALFLLWWLFFRTPSLPSGVETVNIPAATEAASATASVPAEGTVAIPTGAGVTTEMRDGKPVVKVYFNSGKSDVAPAFAAAAGGLKAYLDSHAGSSLTVSGFNDPTGNAAFNAQLAKDRAQHVQADLVTAGIPEASSVLVPPASATDATTNLAGARRVEVTVK